jgi:very-short-patch-repair endonuclease
MDKIRPLIFARNLRKNQSSAEQKLWSHLRRRGVGGFRFNRQFRIGPYVVDFLCREKAVVVEVDGATHGEKHELTYDAARTVFAVSRISGPPGYQRRCV